MTRYTLEDGRARLLAQQFMEQSKVTPGQMTQAQMNQLPSKVHTWLRRREGEQAAALAMARKFGAASTEVAQMRYDDASADTALSARVCEAVFAALSLSGPAPVGQMSDQALAEHVAGMSEDEYAQARASLGFREGSGEWMNHNGTVAPSVYIDRRQRMPADAHSWRRGMKPGRVDDPAQPMPSRDIYKR